jgi:hypothetical protein
MNTATRLTFSFLIYHISFVISPIKKTGGYCGYMFPLVCNIRRLTKTERTSIYKFNSRVLWIQPVVKPTTTRTTTINKSIAHAGIPRRCTTVRLVPLL